MRSDPARLVVSCLILPGSHLGKTIIFHMNTRKKDSPARRQLKNTIIFFLHDGLNILRILPCYSRLVFVFTNM